MIHHLDLPPTQTIRRSLPPLPPPLPLPFEPSLPRPCLTRLLATHRCHQILEEDHLPLVTSTGRGHSPSQGPGSSFFPTRRAAPLTQWPKMDPFPVREHAPFDCIGAHFCVVSDITLFRDVQLYELNFKRGSGKICCYFFVQILVQIKYYKPCTSRCFKISFHYLRDPDPPTVTDGRRTEESKFSHLTAPGPCTRDDPLCRPDSRRRGREQSVAWGPPRLLLASSRKEPGRRESRNRPHVPAKSVCVEEIEKQ